jgi:hypothetical protein
MPKWNKQSQSDALQRASGLTAQQVLDELRANGVSDLNALVQARLDELHSLKGGPAAHRAEDELEKGSILVYKCFVLADWE